MKNFDFGFENRHTNKYLLQLKLSKNLFFLKQIHSKKVHIISYKNLGTQLIGDAMITQDSTIALCISTADCLPIMLKFDNAVAAIHAGWRGMELKIISETVLTAQKHFASNLEFAAIGPHIHASHFEVGSDVAEVLQKQSQCSIIHSHAQVNKKYVDLTKMAEFELKQFNNKLDLFISPINTYLSNLHESFRRDKANSTRNYSWITLQR